VKRIEVDPPANADLDAALAAVNALKDAIDAGAALESENLDYAKAALAARKELRTQREYVDQRRAKVHIHEKRRTLDAALATLKASAKAIEAKDPSPKDFDDARDAAKALRAGLADAKPLASQDQGFASYLNELDAAVTKHEKAVDDRWVALSAGKHRALVEAAQKDFAAATGGITKGATDEQFKAADQSIVALNKLLEEGKPLEDKDAGYRGYAAKVRGDIAAARKRLDAAWSESGVERLKAEIEPAHKDLQASLKQVRARKPTEEQLAEAKTAAIVVRKLLEKFQPEADRSQAFGEYVAKVKDTLHEVEGLLQIRALDAASADVKQALRPLEKKSPTDEQFDVANSALLVLEKTLEPMNAKDPLVAAYVVDGKNLLRDARASANKRRIEVDVERQQKKVEEARGLVSSQLDKPDLNRDQLEAAERSVALMGKVLDEGTELTRRDKGYAAYDREVRKRMGEMTKKIAARRLALSAADARTQLADAVTTAKAKLEEAKRPPATDADLEAAQKAVEAIEKLLEANAPLEQQNGTYAAAADRTRNDTLYRLMDTLETTRQVRDLRKRTGDTLAAGVALFDQAAALKDLRAQRATYEKALAQFSACKDESKMVNGNPQREKTVVMVGDRSSTAKDVVAECAQRVEATNQAIKPVVALIAFEDGPKKAYELARKLLTDGKKTEALTQFDECTASGIVLQHRNPDFKDRAFPVAGKTMTLGEVIKDCSAQSKALRGK